MQEALLKEISKVPYKSAAQRKFLHAKHPDIAAKWDKEYGGKIKRAAKRRQKKGKK